MKDFIRQLIVPVSDTRLKRLLIREYLQARLLQSLQDGGAFTTWAFVGGTALRLLYAMPRFSEDLDFSLARPGQCSRFEDRIARVQKAFLAENYDVDVKVRTEGAVQNAFVKFAGLFYELGCSAHASEVASIKVEIDTNPPHGATLETTVFRRHVLLNVQHYDRASLLAGKLHAVLSRGWAKGRDVYDLVWYLSDRTWPGPNVELLRNALEQTDWQGQEVDKSTWRQVVADRIRELDFKTVTADVEPFLERPEDIAMINQETLLKLLKA